MSETKSWSRKSTKHLWPKAVEMARAGALTKDIAKETGLSRATIVRALREAGIKRKRGFESMPREQVLAICSKGGKAAQATGKPKRFDSNNGAAMARLGWEKRPRSSEHMQEIGRLGGLASAGKKINGQA